MRALMLLAAAIAAAARRPAAVEDPKLASIPLRARAGSPLELETDSLSLQYPDPACPAQPSVVPMAAPLPAGITTALQAANSSVQSLLQAFQAAGGSLDISYMGSPLIRGARGFATLATQRMATADTPFRIASVSKVFAAVMLYQLHDQGYLNLDDPVVSHVPNFTMIDRFEYSKGQYITFRHLASHMAGMPREIPYGAQTTDAVLAALAETLLINRPGSTVRYSNLGFSLLGWVLAQYVAPASMTAGGDYATLLNTLIINPLNLTSTGYNLTADALARIATPYVVSGGTYYPLPITSLGWGNPAGGMYSSAADLATLAQEIMAAAAGEPNALGLRPTTARQMLNTIAYANVDGLSAFGAPWELRILSQLNVTIYEKGGNLGGATALFSFVPELRLSLIALWNTGGDETLVAETAWPPLVTGFRDVLATLQPPIPAGPSPAAYAGTFACSPACGIPSLNVYSTAAGELLGLFTGSSAPVSLEYVSAQPDTFQILVPGGTQSCWAEELLALDEQYVLFARNDSGVASLTIPGFVPGGNFVKVA